VQGLLLLQQVQAQVQELELKPKSKPQLWGLPEHQQKQVRWKLWLLRLELLSRPVVRVLARKVKQLVEGDPLAEVAALEARPQDPIMVGAVQLEVVAENLAFLLLAFP